MTEPVDLDGLAELHAATTEGEWASKGWRICALEPFAYVLDTANNKATRTAENQANADWIASTHNEMPRLIVELRAARERPTKEEVGKMIESFASVIKGLERQRDDLRNWLEAYRANLHYRLTVETHFSHATIRRELKSLEAILGKEEPPCP